VFSLLNLELTESWVRVSTGVLSPGSLSILLPLEGFLWFLGALPRLSRDLSGCLFPDLFLCFLFLCEDADSLLSEEIKSGPSPRCVGSDNLLISKPINLSILVYLNLSFSLTKVMASPLLSARAVRPTRCT